MVSYRRDPLTGRKKRAIKPHVAKAMEEGDIEDLMMKMTPRQIAFAQEYIKDFNATAAARRAGYTGDYINRQGYQLLTHPAVRKVIDFLLQERSAAIDVDVPYVIRKLVNTLERAEAGGGDYNSILRAAELLGKYLGMFVEKQEITGKDGAPIQYEKVSESADEFTRTIARLAARNEEKGPPPDTLQ